jgi:hypothetical protein
VCSGIIIRDLCCSPAAQCLPVSTVSNLLQAALQAGDGQTVQYLCEALPLGVQLLQPEHAFKLLLVS